MTNNEYRERMLILRDRCHGCRYRQALPFETHWCDSDCLSLMTRDGVLIRNSVNTWRSACHEASNYTGKPRTYSLCKIVDTDAEAEAVMYSENHCPGYQRADP